MNAGTLFEDYESGSGWAIVSGGTATLTNEKVKTGTGSLKCVTTSGTNLFAGKTISRTLADVSAIEGWVYVESPVGDVKQTVQISVNFFFFTAGFAGSISTKNADMSLNHGWNYISLGRLDWTLTSAVPTDTFTTLRVKVNAYSGQVLTVHFDSLYLNRTARPTMVIDFDDGWDTTYTVAFPYMSARGVPASILLVPDFVAQSNRVTLAQVQEMYAAGWDVNNHTQDHVTQDGNTSEATARAAWDNCKDYITTNVGTRRNQHLHCATPTGGYAAGTLAALANGGYLSGRNGEGALIPPFVDNIYHNKIHSVDGLLEDATALINQAKRAISAGAGLRFVFHRLVAGVPAVASEFNIDQFKLFIDWATKNNFITCDFHTNTSLYELQNGRRVPVAA